MDKIQDVPSVEQIQKRLWDDIRAHRNQLLEQVDIQVNKLEDSGKDATDWRAYRQQLRDLPGSCDNPTQVVWPQKPA